MTLTLAHALDRWIPRVKRLAEKQGWPPAWLQELQAYLKQPRMTPEEFWVRYTLKRMDAETQLKATMTEAETGGRSAGSVTTRCRQQSAQSWAAAGPPSSPAVPWTSMQSTIAGSPAMACAL